MAIIGLHGYRYAVLEEKEDGTFEYREIKELKGAKDIKIAPKVDTAELYLDDGLSETSSAIGAREVEIGVGDLPLPIRAELLGLRYKNGVLKEGRDFNPPYIAFGFVAPKSSPKGSERMKWLLKGAPEPIEEEGKTKGDKIEFQTLKIKYKFMPRMDGEAVWTADTDLEGAPTEKEFFSSEFLIKGEKPTTQSEG